MSEASREKFLAGEQAEISVKENAIESISQINDELWSSGGLFSDHITIVKTAPAPRRFLPRLKPHVSKHEETRGYRVLSAYRQDTNNGTITKAVIITPDNKFSIRALDKSTLRNHGSYEQYESLRAVANGEDNESSVFVPESSLQPLSELPEPVQVLSKLMLDVNDRMSSSLDWHIHQNEDYTIDIRQGSIIYM